MRVFLAVFCVLSWLLDGPAARAGAWLFPEGQGQIIFTTYIGAARGAFDASGRIVETPPYRKIEARAYVEHGLTDWLTVVGEGSAMRFSGAPAPGDHLNLLVEEAKAGLPLTVEPPQGPRYEGLGLGAAGARVRLFSSGDYVFSFQSALRTASPEARRFLDMRDAYQIDARVLMGRSFSLFGMTGFADTQIGYRSRGQNGDEIRLDLTAGLRPLDWLTLMAQSFSAATPRGGLAGVVAEQKFQFSGVVDVTRSLSLQLGATAALGGLNQPAERGVICAVWWRY